MKNYVRFFIYSAIILQMSCRQAETENTKIKSDSAQAIVADSGKIESSELAGSETTEVASVKCKFFFKGFEFTEEELEGEGNTEDAGSGEIEEKELVNGDEKPKHIPSRIFHREFDSDKKVFYCYEAEEFHHLEIWGNGKDLSLEIINSDDEIVYRKEHISIQNGKPFKDKKINLNDMIRYRVLVKQGDKIVEEGEFIPEGCR